MITFIIGLFIGGFLGTMFTSMFVIRRKEPACLGQKDFSMNGKSEVPFEEKYQRERQQAI
jgi:hypothetical protein